MSAVDGEEYECPCGKHFKRKPTFDRHMEIAHSHTAHHKCQHCGKTFGNENTLTMHMSVHENKQSFVKLCRTRSRTKNAQSDGTVLDEKTKEKEKENLDRNLEKRMKTRSDDKVRSGSNTEMSNLPNKKSDIVIQNMKLGRHIDGSYNDSEKNNQITKENNKIFDKVVLRYSDKNDSVGGENKANESTDKKLYVNNSEKTNGEVGQKEKSTVAKNEDNHTHIKLDKPQQNDKGERKSKESIELPKELINKTVLESKMNGYVSGLERSVTEGRGRDANAVLGEMSVYNSVVTSSAVAPVTLLSDPGLMVPTMVSSSSAGNVPGMTNSPILTGPAPVTSPRVHMSSQPMNTPGVSRPVTSMSSPLMAPITSNNGFDVPKGVVNCPITTVQSMMMEQAVTMSQIVALSQQDNGHIMGGSNEQMTSSAEMPGLIAVPQGALQHNAGGVQSEHVADLLPVTLSAHSQGPFQHNLLDSEDLTITGEDEEDYDDDLEEMEEEDGKQTTRKSGRRRTANPIWKSLITGKVYDEVLDTLDGSPEAKKAKRRDSNGSNMTSDEPFEDLTLLPVDISKIKTEIDDSLYNADGIDTCPDSPKRKKAAARRRSSISIGSRSQNGGRVINAYECFVCGKTFVSEKYLSMHISLHQSATIKTEAPEPQQQQQQQQQPSSLPDVTSQITQPMALPVQPAQQIQTPPVTSSMMSINSLPAPISSPVPTCLPAAPALPAVPHQTGPQAITNTAPVLPADINKNAKKGKKGAKNSNDGGWTCTLCNKTFAHNSGYKNHMRTHSNERPYVCTICDIGFKEKYHLKKHNLFIHSTEMPEKCKFCGKRFKDSTAVRAHERIHSDERPFACRRCNKTFKTSECLWHHEHRSKTCGQALVDTIAQERLVRRRRKFPKSESQSEDSQDQDDNKMVQIKEEPTDMDEFDADIAPEDAELLLNGDLTKPEIDDSLINSIASSLDTANCLDQIPVMVKNEKDIPFLYNNPSPISGHQMNFDDNEHIYSNDNMYANDHMLNNLDCIDASSGDIGKDREKAYTCSLCSKGFLDLAAFQRHSKVHTEERPFVCGKCDIGFKMKVHLKKHNLYVHSDDYPCKCQHCGKRFKDSSAVKLHERTHSDSRPFQCSGCGKAFKTRENLWGHQHRGKCLASKQGEKPASGMGKSVNNENISAHASVDSNHMTAQAYVSTSQVTARAVIENNQVTAHATFANNHVTAHASVINNQLTAHASIMNTHGTVAQASVGNVNINGQKEQHFNAGNFNNMKHSENVYQNGHHHPPTPPETPGAESYPHAAGERMATTAESTTSTIIPDPKVFNLHYSQAKSRASPIGIMSTTPGEPVIQQNGTTVGVPVTTSQSTLPNNAKWPTLKEFLFHTIGPIKEPPPPQQTPSPPQLVSHPPQIISQQSVQQIVRSTALPPTTVSGAHHIASAVAHQIQQQNTLVHRSSPVTLAPPQQSALTVPRGHQTVALAPPKPTQELRPSTSVVSSRMVQQPTAGLGQPPPAAGLAQQPATAVIAQRQVNSLIAASQPPPAPPSTTWYSQNAKVIQNNNNNTADQNATGLTDYPALKERLTRSFLGQALPVAVSTVASPLTQATTQAPPYVTQTTTTFGSTSGSGAIPSFQSTFLSKRLPPPPLNLLQNPSPMMRSEDPSIPIIYWDEDQDHKGGNSQWHSEHNDAIFHDISETVFTQL